MVVTIIVALGSLAWFNQEKVKGLFKKKLSAEEQANIVVTYINKNLLSNGVTAELVPPVIEESGLYKLKIKIQEQEIELYMTKDAKYLFVSPPLDLTKTPQGTGNTSNKKTIGDFETSNEEVCEEDGKPIVYFFGSQGCPHCLWEHPIVEGVTGKFADYISFHNNTDSGSDSDVFNKYSKGGVPTLVIGCRYFREGSGEHIGKEEEERVLTALICKLTNNNPTDVCASVQDLISEIKN